MTCSATSCDRDRGKPTTCPPHGPAHGLGREPSTSARRARWPHSALGSWRDSRTTDLVVTNVPWIAECTHEGRAHMREAANCGQTSRVPHVLRSEISVIDSALTSCPRLHRQPACCVSASRCRPIRRVAGAVLRAGWLPGTCIGSVKHVAFHRLPDSRRGLSHGIALEQHALSMCYIAPIRSHSLQPTLCRLTGRPCRQAMVRSPSTPTTPLLTRSSPRISRWPACRRWALRVIRLLCGPSERTALREWRHPRRSDYIMPGELQDSLRGFLCG